MTQRARTPLDFKIAGTGAKSYPTGYLVGRFSQGYGPLEFLGQSQLRGMGLASQDELTQRTSNAGFGFFAGGLLLDNETLGTTSFPFQVTFRDGNAATLVNCLVAPTGIATFRIMVSYGGIPTQVGSIVFAAASNTGVVSWIGAELVLAAGEQITLLAPTPADATLGSVTGTVTGTK